MSEELIETSEGTFLYENGRLVRVNAKPKTPFSFLGMYWYLDNLALPRPEGGFALLEFTNLILTLCNPALPHTRAFAQKVLQYSPIVEVRNHAFFSFCDYLADGRFVRELYLRSNGDLLMCCRESASRFTEEIRYWKCETLFRENEKVVVDTAIRETANTFAFADLLGTQGERLVVLASPERQYFESDHREQETVALQHTVAFCSCLVPKNQKNEPVGALPPLTFHRKKADEPKEAKSLGALYVNVPKKVIPCTVGNEVLYPGLFPRLHTFWRTSICLETPVYVYTKTPRPLYLCPWVFIPGRKLLLVYREDLAHYLLEDAECVDLLESMIENSGDPEFACGAIAEYLEDRSHPLCEWWRI